MVPFAPLLSALAEIPDPRRPQGTRYPLAHLLLFSRCWPCSRARPRTAASSPSSTSTATGWAGSTASACAGRRRSPRCATGSWRSIHRRWRPPSGATPGQLGEGRPDGPRAAVALDGKTLRRSSDRLHDRAAAHVPGAFAAADAALILGQQEVPEVPEEVQAAQAMIGDLGLHGVIFTADALHCQKNLRHRPSDRQRRARPGQGQPARPA